MKKLREEIADLKEQLRETIEEARRRGSRKRGIYIDIGNRIHDYIEDILEGVAEGISGELERSIFIGPHGIKVYRGYPPREELKIDLVRAAEVMSALGNEYRLRILSELMHGGKYISDLQEILSEIASSTLSSHLDVLEKAGLVVQEKVRGRYLITIPGRMAYKMAKRIAKTIRRAPK